MRGLRSLSEKRKLDFWNAGHRIVIVVRCPILSRSPPSAGSVIRIGNVAADAERLLWQGHKTLEPGEGDGARVVNIYNALPLCTIHLPVRASAYTPARTRK